jgi:type IV secretory pathway VirB4 component
MPKTTKPKYKSTQSYLTLKEVKSDTLILEDNVYCAILAVSSINFSLKSQEEQNALIYVYQNFLNSLDFPIQILMQSRKMDIHAYLEKVRLEMERQTNELLRIQTAEYIQFIDNLIENASIMNKSFYVMITYGAAAINVKAGGGIFGLLGKKDDTTKLSKDLAAFKDEKLKLEQRVNTVLAGLSGLGLRCARLQTEEIVELLYNSYNFGAGPLIDASKLGEVNLVETK